jgi:hypothetical protein
METSRGSEYSPALWYRNSQSVGPAWTLVAIDSRACVCRINPCGNAELKMPEGLLAPSDRPPPKRKRVPMGCVRYATYLEDERSKLEHDERIPQRPELQQLGEVGGIRGHPTANGHPPCITRSAGAAR